MKWHLLDESPNSETIERAVAGAESYRDAQRRQEKLRRQQQLIRIDAWLAHAEKNYPELYWLGISVAVLALSAAVIWISQWFTW